MSISQLLGRLRRKASSIPLRPHARRIISASLYSTGLTRAGFRLVRSLDRRRRLVAVVYHKVVPSEIYKRADGVRVEHFRDQVRTLRELFEVRQPDEAVAALKPDARNGSRYPVLVTFDDGFANNLEYAVPILREQRVPAVFFITTSLIGTQRFLWTDEVRELLLQSPLKELRLFPGGLREQRFPLEARQARLKAASLLKRRLKYLPLPAHRALLGEIRIRSGVSALRHHPGTTMLSWDEVRRMRLAGMSIGSHSGHHFIVTTLSDADFEADMAESQAVIERHLGEPARHFAYPNGHPEDFDQQKAAILRRGGITHAFTMIPAIASEQNDPLMLPRYAVTDEPGAVMALELLRLLARDVLADWLGRPFDQAGRSGAAPLRSTDLAEPPPGREAA